MEPITVLNVNLTTGAAVRSELPRDVRNKYIGGMGLASHLLFEAEAYKHDPLSPENTFVLAVGPLAGSVFPGSSRFETAFRSPQTNGIGYASCGGFLTPELRNAGLDAIVITGASDKPVYLNIKDGVAEIRDASHLWGKDTYATEEEIRVELGDKRVRVAAIGPAGENLVKFAALMAGRHNFAARGGPGAVLGSKKLKAIAVRATKKRPIANPDLYAEMRKRIKGIIETDVSAKAFHDFGTDSTMQLGMMVTDVPTKNWRVADWTDGSEKLNGIYMAETILTARKSCHACSIACKRVVNVKEGKYKTDGDDIGPEYETAASMGTLLLNDDLGAVTAANRICNMLGLDTISAGSTIACAIEAFEGGLLTVKDTDGLTLKWGDMDTVFKLLEKTARREGFGNRLAEGSKRLAASIGRGAEEFAIHSKGLELPMHDPRAYHGMALAYAMSNRGACHTKHLDIVVEMGAYKYPDFGIKGHYSPISKDDKAEMTAHSEELGNVISSLVLCMFTAYALTGEIMSKMIKSVDGADISTEELRRAGERIWLLQRSFNVLCGFTAADDTLPARVLHPHIEGQVSGLDKVVYQITSTQLPSNLNVRRKILKTYDFILPRQAKLVRFMGKLMFFKKLRAKEQVVKGSPELDAMKRDYYTLRGLDPRGVPTKQKLAETGLEHAAKLIYN